MCPLLKTRWPFRASVDYLNDPGFIDYNYLVREAGVSNPQPNFSDPADVSANLKQEKDANTEETWSGRAALRYTAERLDGTLYLLLPGSGYRRAPGQPPSCVWHWRV